MLILSHKIYCFQINNEAYGVFLSKIRKKVLELKIISSATSNNVFLVNEAEFRSHPLSTDLNEEEG